MKQATYLPTSWQAVTDEIKQHFSWDGLTQESASDIMKMYLKQTPIAEMIKQLEGMK